MALYNTGTAFILFSLLCGMAYPQNAGSPCRSENRWAFLVIAETSPNDTTRQSAKSLEKSFRQGLELAGFPKDHIVSLTQEKQDPLLRPTLENIRVQLQRIKSPDAKESLPGQSPLRQVEEACEVFAFVQMLGVQHGAEQYLCPLTDAGKPTSPNEPTNLLPVSEVSEAFARSSVERRLLVMNVLSPVATRAAASRKTWDGINSKTLLKEVPVVRAGFGQVIVNDQIDVVPGTIDGFIDIFLRGLSGYADSTLQGNRDRCVTLRELTDYLEYYGNMASAGAVKTMLLGHDYPISLSTETTSKSLSDSGTREILERVGKGMLNLKTGNTRTPDYESAVESFLRAAAFSDKNRVLVQVSRNTSIYAEKEGRSRRPVRGSDSLLLLDYDKGWFHVESGWIRADVVVSLEIVKK